MSVLSIELPRHVQYAAMEEILLLQALRNLYQPKQLDPCFALFTRNELVYAAEHLLPVPELRGFLCYADQLARCLLADTVVQLPPPGADLCRGASRAETIAHAFLKEGAGSLWSAVREVVRDLGYAADRRVTADGYIFRLGLYNKGGLVGLTSETKSHLAVCRLLNTLVVATYGAHRWTSLSVNMNCSTEVHKDQCNASEDHLQSLQIGLSHYDHGELWIEDSQGCVYLEHHRDGLLRGSARSTHATASLFHAQRHYHATLPWSNGDRVVLIAYVARQHACAMSRYGGILEEAGFVLPHCGVERAQTTSSAIVAPPSPAVVEQDHAHGGIYEPFGAATECKFMEQGLHFHDT